MKEIARESNDISMLSNGRACRGNPGCALRGPGGWRKKPDAAKQNDGGMIESIILEKCTGCGVCDRVCPADVIHMEPAPVASEMPGLRSTRMLPVIRFREHCITCFSCEIFCPEGIVDVHPSVKNRPRPW
jgi:NAD-dependent dihydropyrimidine dehydrogenase PreA subunit